jgi:hypothetical protein
MATVLEQCATDEQRSVVRFLWQNDSMQRIFIKKCFLFTVGSVVHNWVEKRGKCFADDEEVETDLRKWLRQQSKRLLCCGFRRTGKSIGKYINVGGFFLHFRITHVLRFISIWDLFTDSPL